MNDDEFGCTIEFGMPARTPT